MFFPPFLNMHTTFMPEICNYIMAPLVNSQLAMSVRIEREKKIVQSASLISLFTFFKRRHFCFVTLQQVWPCGYCEKQAFTLPKLYSKILKLSAPHTKARRIYPWIWINKWRQTKTSPRKRWIKIVQWTQSQCRHILPTVQKLIMFVWVIESQKLRNLK